MPRLLQQLYAKKILVAAIAYLVATGALVSTLEHSPAAKLACYVALVLVFAGGCVAICRFMQPREAAAQPQTCRGKQANWALRVFVVLYVCIGATAMLAVPMGEGYDEREHYLRAYQITQGASTVYAPDSVMEENSDGVFSVGAYLPTGAEPSRYGAGVEENSYPNVIASLGTHEIDCSTTTYYGFLNSTLYTGVTYAAYYPGILLAQLFCANSLVLAYAARVSGWLIFGLLIALAIRRMPYARWLVAFVCLLPSTFMVWVCVSGDGLVLCASLLLLAEVLHMRKLRTCMPAWQKAYLWLLVLLVALCKLAYLPVCLLLLLVPKTCYRSHLGVAVNRYLCLAIACVCAIAWILHGMGLLSGVSYDNDANSSEQASYVLSHPLAFLATCVLTLLNEAFVWFQSLCGYGGLALYNSQTGLPALVIGLLIVGSVFVCAEDDELEASALNTGARVLIALVAFFVLALIMGSLYVQYNSVGAQLIDGIQGRYFLPVLVPLILLVRSLVQSARQHRLSNECEGNEALPAAGMFTLTPFTVIVFFAAVMLEFAAVISCSW